MLLILPRSDRVVQCCRKQGLADTRREPAALGTCLGAAGRSSGRDATGGGASRAQASVPFLRRACDLSVGMEQSTQNHALTLAVSHSQVPIALQLLKLRGGPAGLLRPLQRSDLLLQRQPVRPHEHRV